MQAMLHLIVFIKSFRALAEALDGSLDGLGPEAARRPEAPLNVHVKFTHLKEIAGLLFYILV